MAKATSAKAKVSTKATPAKVLPLGKGGRTPASKSLPPTPAKPAAASTITLKHLAAGLMERHDIPKQQSVALVEHVFGKLVDHLKAGDRVRINGLGVIEVKSRPARMGRNPATGEAIQIKASKKVTFRASKDLKDAI